jgi:hypothetical protein
MSFATSARAALRRVATRILRAAFLVVVVCLAVPFVLAWWFLYAVVAVRTVVAIAIWGPPALFRYEEDEKPHDHP